MMVMMALVALLVGVLYAQRRVEKALRLEHDLRIKAEEALYRRTAQWEAACAELRRRSAQLRDASAALRATEERFRRLRRKPATARLATVPRKPPAKKPGRLVTASETAELGIFT